MVEGSTFEGRDGYRDDFLGSGRLQVKIPWLSDDQYSMVAFNRFAQRSRHVLPYRHFSIAMNRKRRLAFFTAVNIDGNTERRPSSFRARWSFDDRIERDAQIGGEFYEHNPLDRGHLVRRLDPAWGPDERTAKVAVEDTFHWTNCGPQHQGFNRQQGVWADLENYILYNANNRDFKVSVFTGPLFRNDDPEYQGVRIPVQYWKVVSMVTINEALSSTAYLVTQNELVDDFLEESFTFGRFKTFQVRVSDLEDKIGLSFRDLRHHDPMATNLELESSSAKPWHELSVAADIQL